MEAALVPDQDFKLKVENWRQRDENIAQLLPSLSSEDQTRDFLKHWKHVREKQKTEEDLIHNQLRGESKAPGIIPPARGQARSLSFPHQARYHPRSKADHPGQVTGGP